jgi:hypothetical protein
LPALTHLVSGHNIAAWGELHERAHAKLQRAGKFTTLDTTGLVHECYLRLSGVGRLQVSDRVHFLCYAASTGAAVPGPIGAATIQTQQPQSTLN